MHDQYDPNVIYADIALVKVSGNFKITEYVKERLRILKIFILSISDHKINDQLSLKDLFLTVKKPACLPENNFTPQDDAVCAITGWGETDGSKDRLNQVTIPIVNLKQYVRIFYS